MKVEGQRSIKGPYSLRGMTGAQVPAPVPTGAPPSAVRGAGDATTILGIPENEFTPRVRDAIMRLMAEVEKLRQDLDHTKRRLDAALSEADQDPLLPVLNRRAFVRAMSRIMAFAERYSMPAAMIYLDLNGFKAVNDSHGHAAGDAALMHVTKLLAENIRETDALGRLGGDEFGLILAKADQDTATTKAASLNTVLQGSPFRWQGEALALSFSFGVYEFRVGEDANTALAQADEAMYRDKRARKSRTAKTEGARTPAASQSARR